MWGGVITFLLTGLGAVTSVAFRNSAPVAVMLGGCLGLVGGAVVTAAAIMARTPALLLLGTVLAGLGFGPGNLGAYRVIMARAAASDRAGLIAAISTVQYLAFGLPALIAAHRNLAFWPARHRTGLLRRDRPARRRRRRRPPVREQCPHPRTPGNPARSRTAAGPVHRATVHASSATGS